MKKVEGKKNGTYLEKLLFKVNNKLCFVCGSISKCHTKNGGFFLLNQEIFCSQKCLNEGKRFDFDFNEKIYEIQNDYSLIKLENASYVVKVNIFYTYR
jgi:hypothetical protein